MQYVDTGGINTDELEFDSLNLNNRVINRITNNTINTYSKTHTFTGHGAILWRGSFLVLLEEMMAQTVETLQSLIHPATHPADMIEETVDRLWMTPAEKDKLTGVEYGANNYTHPATHSLDIITSTDTRKILTVTEKTKLDGVEENANNYVHPTTHSTNEFSDLLDVDGFLIAPLPSYTYLGDRHFIPMEIDINLGGIQYIVDNVYGIDSVSYIGGGWNVEVPVSYRLGFGDYNSGSLFILFNYATGNTYDCFYTSLNEDAVFIQKSNMRLPKGGELFKVLDDKIIDLTTESNELRAFLGFKFNNKLSHNPPSIYEMGLYDNYTAIFKRTNVRINNEEGINAKRLFFTAGYESYYISGTNDMKLKLSEDSTIVQNIPTYLSKKYVYTSDLISNREHFTNILVQHDADANGIKFRILYWRNTPYYQDNYFQSLTTTNTTFKHINGEFVTKVAVSPYIVLPGDTIKTANEHVYCSEYLLTFLTQHPLYASAWITIYRINLVTKTISLFQTLTVNGGVMTVALTYNKATYITPDAYKYSNLLAFYSNNNIYIYSRYMRTNNTFALRHTIPIDFDAATDTEVYESEFLDQSTLILKNLSHIILLRIISSGAGILSEYIPTNVVDNNPYFSTKYLLAGTICNYIPFLTRDFNIQNPYSVDMFGVGKKLLMCLNYHAPDWNNLDLSTTHGALYDVLTDKVIQQFYLEGSGSVELSVDISFGIKYDYTNAKIDKILLSVDSHIAEYTYQQFESHINTQMGIMMWNHRIHSISSNYNLTNHMNKLPIAVFCFKTATLWSSHKSTIMIYDGKQYTVDFSGDVLTTQQGFDGYYQPFSVANTHTTTLLKYISIDEDVNIRRNGETFVYLGVFGETYQVIKNLTSADVKGIKDKTCVFTAVADDVYEIGFIPNIIILREANTTGFGKVIVQNIGYNKYINWSDSSINDNSIVTVSGDTLTFSSGIQDMVVVALAMDTHELISDLSINASGVNPFFASLNNGFNSIGERDKTFTKTENTIPVIYDLGEGEVNHYLSINKFGDFTLNNKDGLLNYEWSKPDDMLFHGTNDFQPSVSEGASHLPLAKIRAVDGVINEVIQTAKDTSYTTSWKLLNSNSSVVFDNKYMTEQIYVEVQYVDNLADTTIVLLGNTITTLDHEFITISSILNQEIIPGFNSAYVRLIVKRLF